MGFFFNVLLFDGSQGESVLKVQYLIDEKLKNRLDGPSVNELCELFYANKEDFKRRLVP